MAVTCPGLMVKCRILTYAFLHLLNYPSLHGPCKVFECHIESYSVCKWRVPTVLMSKFSIEPDLLLRIYGFCSILYFFISNLCQGTTPETNSIPQKYQIVYCVTSIYAAWHIRLLCHLILWRRCRFLLSSVSSVVTLSIPDSISKNGLSDLIQLWHVDVTAPKGVLYSLVILNSH